MLVVDGHNGVLLALFDAVDLLQNVARIPRPVHNEHADRRVCALNGTSPLLLCVRSMVSDALRNGVGVVTLVDGGDKL